MPRVLVNERFHARVAPRRARRTGVPRRALANANWLVRSLQQRAQTILKVAAEIMRQQDGFLRHGVAHLRPLILRDIAEAVEMHESTVSRVTANKYIATPRGMFELKYFFTTAIAGTDGGESHSAEAVRHRIRALDRAPRRRATSCPTTRSSQRCAGKAWTSRAGPWPNTARRCASPTRCSASGRKPRLIRTVCVQAEWRRAKRRDSIGSMRRTACRSRFPASRSNCRTRCATRVSDQLDPIAGKYFDHALEAHVTFSRARSFFTCDINVHAGRGLTLARRGRGGRRHTRVRRRGRAHRQAAAPLPPAGQRPCARHGAARRARGGAADTSCAPGGGATTEPRRRGRRPTPR